MSNSKLKVIYLAGGYPTPDNPSHGIFNQRAAHAIKEYADLTVVQYRIYKPGRKFFEKKTEDGFTRIILCVPYSPVMEKRMHYFNNRMFYLFSRMYISALLKKADIVHASDGTLSVFASWLKKKYKFKLLAQFIGGDLNQDLPQFYKKGWMKNWKKNIDAVSFNSKALEKIFKELFGNYNLGKVIYRGVDTGRFFPAKNKAGGIVFYFLGGLPNYSTFKHGRNTKGGLNLLQAWTKIDSEFKNDKIKLLFAGPDSDLPVVKETKIKLFAPDRLEIIGSINPADIPAFHQSGNVCLVPSLEEGLPNVAMEAAASGNVVIANAVGGIPEIITDNVNGILCETNDTDGLYEKMKWIINNQGKIDEIGNTAVQMISSDFSSKDFGKKYFEFYQQLLQTQ